MDTMVATISRSNTVKPSLRLIFLAEAWEEFAASTVLHLRMIAIGEFYHPPCAKSNSNLANFEDRFWSGWFFTWIVAGPTSGRRRIRITRRSDEENFSVASSS